MGKQSLIVIFNDVFKKEQHDVSYEGGNHIFMIVQVSELSYQWIIDLRSSVGCISIEVVRYKILGKTIVDDLSVIFDDFDARSLISHFNISDNIEIYVQHPFHDGRFRESSR